jgi:hypothetical protein
MVGSSEDSVRRTGRFSGYDVQSHSSTPQFWLQRQLHGMNGVSMVSVKRPIRCVWDRSRSVIGCACWSTTASTKASGACHKSACFCYNFRKWPQLPKTQAAVAHEGQRPEHQTTHHERVRNLFLLRQKSKEKNSSPHHHPELSRQVARIYRVAAAIGCGRFGPQRE